MLTNLSFAFVAALAITADASHAKHHHLKRQYDHVYGASNSSTTSVTPLPSASTTEVPISSSSVAIGTGSSAIPLPSSSVPYGTSPSATSRYVPNGTGSSFPFYSTGTGASQAPSKYIPLGTGSSPPPFPSSSKSGSLSPSITGPLGTGVTEAPGKVTIVTSDSTLTYTAGSGSDSTVITTHIKQTLTKTLTRTIYKTEVPSATGEEGAGGVPESVSPTTTKYTTVTSTNVITVEPVASSEASSESPSVGQKHVIQEGAKCPAPVTVTVTGAPVTVTVTTTPSAAEQSPSPVAEESPLSSALPSYSSAPYFNGTEAVSSTTRASSGFLTYTSSFTLKPSGTGILPTGTAAYY